MTPTDLRDVIEALREIADKEERLKIAQSMAEKFQARHHWFDRFKFIDQTMLP